MNSKNPNQIKEPSLRFPEFKKEWINTKLGIISEIKPGQFISRKDILFNNKTGGGHPIISGGKSVLGYSSTYNQEGNTITIARAGLAGYVSFQKNRFFLSDACFALKIINPHIQTLFLFYALKKKQSLIYQLKTSTSIPTINTKTIKNISIKFPSLPEQSKLSSFFKLFDDYLINLKQQKERIEQLKKYCLQNMLVSSNEEIPKIRFKEFKERWNLNLLSNFIIESTFRNQNNEDIPVFSVTNKNFVLQKEFFHGREITSKDKKNYKVIYHHMFAYNPARINIGSIALFNETIGQVSLMYFVFKTQNIDVHYLEFYFRSYFFSQQVIKNLEGSVRKVINFHNLKNFKIYLPSLLEQSKLSSFFKLFDDYLINLKQQIELIQQIKKSLLNQMLI